jgi:hypothetical protein
VHLLRNLPLHLLQGKFQRWIHRTVPALEAGEVVVGNLVLQIEPARVELPGSSSNPRMNSKNRTRTSC